MVSAFSIVLLAATVLLSPAARAAERPEEVVRSYRFTVEAQFETVGEDEALTKTDQLWTGTLDRRLARVFRDGSRGWEVALGEVREDRGDGPVKSPLDGLAFELRTFATGEVLRLGSFRALVGEGRDGELLAPLWWALSPLPPAMKKGTSATRRSTFPLLIEGAGGIRFQATKTWTHHGRSRLDGERGRRLLHLSYRGPIVSKGRDATFLGETQLSGEVAGELWLDPTTLEVMRHDVDWRLEYAASPESSGWKRHTQRLAVRLESVDSRPRGPDEPLFTGPEVSDLPLYLDATRIRDALHAGQSRWAGCFTAEEGAAPAPVSVRVNVFASGEFGSIQALDPTGDPETIACLRRGAEDWTLPSHHESSVEFRYVVVSRAGGIQPYPIVEWEPRSLGVLFLRVPVGDQSLVE